MAKGFFQAKGEEIATKMCRTEDCEACLLYKNAQAKLTFAGEGRLGILIVGPSPSAAEEDAKEYFHGRDYEFLKTALESIGISLEEDCYYLSALSCRPPYNRGAKRIEISSCGPRVWRYIQRLKPSVIICLGEDAFDTIIGPRISGRLLGTGYNKFYGNLIPDQELKTHLMVTYSVKELMSKRTYEDGASSKPLYERDKAVYRLWLQHLYDACSAYNKPVEAVDYARLCKPTQDIDQALEWIEEAMSWPAVAFDYETTGIKPHREGHRIVCASISNGSVSYAFPFFDDDTFQRAWKRLMESSVKKIAHNLSFEYLWTKEICGYWAKNVYWDTMLAAHCLHNLKPVGLKFCTYTEFGVIGYDESADPYLKSSEKDRNEFGDNAFNKIDKAPLADLLLYNALDSLFTYRLYERQMGRLEPFQKEGFDLLMESSLALTETTQYGCILNVERFHEVVGELEKKMDDAARAVMESDEVKLWDKDTEFNFNSPRQIGHLLYDILGIKPPFFTETGAPSTDAEALEKIKIPLVEKILTYRKYMKLLKTYIRQYSVESVDGLIHAWFHLHKVDTFRSCVAKGTLIAIDREGSLENVPIEEVRPGDMAYTYDDALKLTTRPVIWAGKTGHKKVVEVGYPYYTGYGTKTDILRVTPEHRIRLLNGEYVCAVDTLGVPVLALTQNGETVCASGRIAGSLVPLEGYEDVYDIEVEETHNFIANEICVHNSSAAPNIQNLPKRDDEAKTLITSLIRPRRGHRIISYDYKSLEVLINACHSGDKNLIAYASDPSKDMHRDSAADIFMLDPGAVPKAVRSAIKGAFVFASFYGSYYKQTAPDCWDVAKANGILPHLAEKGITTYEKFEDRVRIAEEIMWTERFPIHDAWRKEQWKKYQRDGYLNSLTGFRLYGPMSRNNSFNGVVQGDAYHILQWSFNQVLRELKERGMETRPWAEIHDAADFDCAPGEETILDALVYKYFIVEVKKKWPWIVVNLQVEKERSEIDGDWSHMESCGYLTE